MTPFTLAPYPGAPHPADVRVSGEAHREGAVITLTWRLQGPAFVLPPAQPERRDELWQTTCFEFFLAIPGRPGYWEFNLSPAGHWNIYRFEGYRAGMQDEAAFDSLPFSVSQAPGGWEVLLQVDMTRLRIAGDDWRVAIATVVAEPDGRITYWALSHPGDQPDFHHPDAFTMQLAS